MKQEEKNFSDPCNKTPASPVILVKGGRKMDLSLAAQQTNQSHTDHAILDRCLEGVARQDSGALAELYHRTRGAVYAFALSLLKNPHDAEDVLHDCYVRIYAAAGQYRSQGKPLAWMLTIARNLCLESLRQRGRTEPLPEADWSRWLEGKEGLSSEDRLLLAQCMQGLGDQERQIVALHAVAGFKHREIAQMLSLPLPTVLSKYRRAKRKLQAALAKGEVVK